MTPTTSRSSEGLVVSVKCWNSSQEVPGGSLVPTPYDILLWSQGPKGPEPPGGPLMVQVLGTWAPSAVLVPWLELRLEEPVLASWHAHLSPIPTAPA